MRPRLHVVVTLTVLLLLGGCEGGRSEATPSPSAEATPRCANQPAAEERPVPPSASFSGDVDGDGSQDSVHVVGVPEAVVGCRGFVIVERAAGTSSLPVSFPELDPEFGFPSVNSLVPINETAGLEIVVNVAAGASSQFLSVFTWDDGTLKEVTVSGDPELGLGVFGYGRSVGHAEGVDCIGRGRVVVGSAIATRKGYRVVRRFLHPTGHAWTVDRSATQVRTLSIEDALALPELRGSPFLNCT